MFFKKSLLLPFILILISCNTPEGSNNTKVLIKTSMGDIKIILYPDTPIHHDNFIKLINSGFYDGVLFHRIIKDFMIQTGDISTAPNKLKNLSDSLKNYTLPSEINRKYFHKRGALAAARLGNNLNPEMRSSGTQFYIVQGVKMTENELNLAEQHINNSLKQNLFYKIIKQTSDSVKLTGKSITDAEIQEIASGKMFQYLTTYDNYKFTEEQRTIYKSIGGTPLLDASYTVFGEVTEGLDVVDKISSVATDNKDKPLSEVKILKIKIEK
jgi:peptidylprolyl isomerase